MKTHPDKRNLDPAAGICTVYNRTLKERIHQQHRHNGHEQFLILDGELHESDGTILKAGDLVFYRDGTEHNSYTPNGCLLAVHIAGPEFPVD